MTVKEIYCTINEALEEHIKKVRKNMTKFYLIFENVFGIYTYVIAENFSICDDDEYYTVYNNMCKQKISKDLYTFKGAVYANI